MVLNEDLKLIFSLIYQRKLSEAIDMTQAYGMKFPGIGVDEGLAEIRSQYQLMADYWSRGFSDEQLEKVYADLLKRLYRLAANLYLYHNITNDAYLQRAYRRVRTTGRDWDVSSVRAMLEEFVGNVTLLQLEPPHVRESREEELFKMHQQMMSDLFVYIVTSMQWSDSQAGAFEELLLSPTIDSNDQQLLVSAVTLSGMNIFDMAKFRLLLSVYRNSTNKEVRQRALVGWVLSMGDGEERIFDEQRQVLNELLSDDAMCNELAELQVQMLYCISAESDQRTIQREIMPELLKHNGFRITPNGIEEKEEDTLENILHPEASEQNMEKLEQSFRRMTEMQKQGADIYFGGFSQMKRFPFFSYLSNWFVPFYKQHPDVSALYKKMGTAKLMQRFVQSGPLCNSDRYSFVFAFQQVIDRIPEKLRELLNGGESLDFETVTSSEANTDAYIRRIYLQDLYRFFKLFPARAAFFNPFDTQGGKSLGAPYVFFAHTLFNGTRLKKQSHRVVAFMLKRKMYDEAALLLDSYSEEARDCQFWMMCGHTLMHKTSLMAASGCLAGLDAVTCYAKAMTFEDAAEHKAAAAYARATFLAGRYEEARRVYADLLEANPDNKNYQLSYSAALVNLSCYEEALKMLYKLNYDYPENRNVIRVLARALTGSGKLEQARRWYEQLCQESDDASDLLNAGYCEWFAVNREAAAKLFAEYVKTVYPSVSAQTEKREHIWEDIIDAEKTYLVQHGITPTECYLMCDLILLRTF